MTGASPRVGPAIASLAFVAVAGYGSRGSLGVFVHPWEEAFGVSRASVSLIGALGFVLVGLAQPIAGRLLEIVRARVLLVVGLLLASLGFLASSFAGAFPVALVLVGVVAAFGAGLASLASLSYVAAEIVERRRGMLFGVLTAAAARGQVVVLPLAAAALEVSLRTALATLAGLLAASAVAAFVLVPDVPVARAARGARATPLASVLRARRSGSWPSRSSSAATPRRASSTPISSRTPSTTASRPRRPRARSRRSPPSTSSASSSRGPSPTESTARGCSPASTPRAPPSCSRCPR